MIRFSMLRIVGVPWSASCARAIASCLVAALLFVSPFASPLAEGDEEPVAAPGAPAHPNDARELLRREEGVWDATIQIAASADGTSGVYNGVETSILMPGGLWLATDFKSRLEGAPFEGHALFGYDASKGKYVRVWVDSSQPYFWPAVGDYDPSTGTLTMWMQSTDTNGNVARWRAVTVWEDPDTRTFTMYVPGTEATDAAGMRITYRRRK
jgi:hypothetical protein